jgi:cobalt-zinc-cadmium efflux system outer membrane protein
LSFHSAIRFRPQGVAVILISVLTGCGSIPRERPDLTTAASRATGLDNAISFKSDTPADGSPTISSAGVLTMQAALRHALSTGPDVRAAMARVRAAEADADQSELLPNPILTVVFRFPTSGARPVIEAGLAADLIALFKRPGQIEATYDRLRAAGSGSLTTVLDAVAEVQTQYISVQSLDALMPVLEERRNLLGRLLQLAENRLKQGEGTSLDVTTLNSQRLELEVEIAEKRLERRRERLALTRLMGDPHGEVEWKVEPWHVPSTVAGSEPDWVRAALENRSEIAAQTWELAALGVEVRLTRFAPFDGGDVGIASERDDVWTLGPAVSTPLPIFDWGQAKRAKAVALRAEARQKLVKAHRQVVQEVRTAYSDFAGTLATVELVRTQLLPSQERRRSQTETAYRAGQTDITALILADQDLQAARAKVVELEQKTAQSFVQLQRAVGGAGVASTMTATRPTTGPADPSMPTTSPTR